MGTVETGALEQSFVKLESAYSVVPADAIVASDGIRHLALALGTKLNRVPSPQKQGTPDQTQSLPRRRTSTWNLSQIMWEPSGTPGTISNVGKLLKGGFGTNHVVTGGLATTTTGVPTTTSLPVAAVTNLAIGDLIAVEVTAGAYEATRITNIVSLTLTVDALSAAPAAARNVYAGITYQLANNITQSFAIYKYYNAGGFKSAAYGCVVGQIQVMFDGTTEVELALQGPAGDFADSDFGTVQAKPGSQTTIGAPVGGMVGSFYVDGNAFLVTAVKASLDNKELLRNSELGTSKASGILGRADFREVTVEITFFLDDRRLMSKANAITTGELRCLVGSTPGSFLAMVCPKVEFEYPDVGSENGPKSLTVTGRAYATAGNDVIYLAEI